MSSDNEAKIAAPVGAGSGDDETRGGDSKRVEVKQNSNINEQESNGGKDAPFPHVQQAVAMTRQISDVELSHQSQKKRKQQNDDSAFFLNSMTFANLSGACGLGDCDCDECEQIPADIRQAILRHKRMAVASQPNFIRPRRQERHLLYRSSSAPFGTDPEISVWKWTLPASAMSGTTATSTTTEPILEYGNSHRIVHVQTVPKNSFVQGIGQGGIIGSSMEVANRRQIPWLSDQTYFLPSNGGRALGWIHVNKKDEKKAGEDEDEDQDVILFMIKVKWNKDAETSWSTSASSSSSLSMWHRRIVQIFQQEMPPPQTHPLQPHDLCGKQIHDAVVHSTIKSFLQAVTGTTAA